MLVNSIFSFSLNVFFSYKHKNYLFNLSSANAFNLAQPKILLFGNELKTAQSFNPFPNKPWFLCVCSTILLKTLWEKEKLLVTSNFSFFHSNFYPFGELSATFIQFEIVVCNLCQFGRVQNLSFVKGLSLTLI